MFEIPEPESQFETSMNITPRKTMLTAPIKMRYGNRTSSPEDKLVLSAMDLRRRAQNRASQRAFRARKQVHTEDLQQQVYKLRKTNEHLLEANVQSVGKLCGMKTHIEGLNLEIAMLQIKLHPQQGRLSGNASFGRWGQASLENELALFDSWTDTFGVQTSPDFTTDQSGMDAVSDQHSAFWPSRVKTSFGDEAIDFGTRKVAEGWTRCSNCSMLREQPQVVACQYNTCF